MYDEMSLIFGEDTATWSSAKSLTDIDSKKRIVDLESNDLDIDFEKASKRKQVSSSNAALSGASSHRKRSKRSRANVNRQFSEQLGIPVELAIEKKKKKKQHNTTLKRGQPDVNELFEVVKIERFVEVMLAAAFGYLLDNERVAKASCPRMLD